MVVHVRLGDSPSVEAKLEIIRAACATMEAILVTLAMLELDRHRTPKLKTETREQSLALLQEYADALMNDAMDDIEKRN